MARSNETGTRLLARLPYSEDNRKWLFSIRQTNQPAWLKADRVWELPKVWLNGFVTAALRRYGKVYIIQPYREDEICAPACWNARGFECQCSCMGANHGGGDPGDFWVVSETLAIRRGAEHLAVRLLTSKRPIEPFVVQPPIVHPVRKAHVLSEKEASEYFARFRR